MVEKNVLSLDNFDFGFTIVNEDELESVQSIKKEIEESSSEIQEWQSQADEWREKANQIYSAVIPLLNNLSANEEKEYIYWPNRTDKINTFKLQLQKILNQ